MHLLNKRSTMSLSYQPKLSCLITFATITHLLFFSSIFHDADAQWKMSSLNLDEVEKQWGLQDDDDDSLAQHEEHYREMERRQSHTMNKLQKLMNEKQIQPGDAEFERLAHEATHQNKPAMIFAKIDENRVNDSFKWNWDSLAGICNEWEVRNYCLVQIMLFFHFLSFSN